MKFFFTAIGVCCNYFEFIATKNFVEIDIFYCCKVIMSKCVLCNKLIYAQFKPHPFDNQVFVSIQRMDKTLEENQIRTINCCLPKKSRILLFISYQHVHEMYQALFYPYFPRTLQSILLILQGLAMASQKIPRSTGFGL